MKYINTLIADIYDAIKNSEGWSPELMNKFSSEIAFRLTKQFGEKKEDRAGLRLSKMGITCPRALWYSVNHPEMAEELPPWAQFKYTYGHMIEALAIGLARVSYHRVEGEQDAVYVDGVMGHRDCVIDGCIVDVKSSSTRSFQKFKDGSIAQNDSFGYLDQLDGYLVGSSEDPLVTTKDRGYILAIDKQLGHMCLYEHRLREENIRNRIASYKAIVASGQPPACTCGTIPYGKSGNIGLDVKASYSPFKFCCFPNLRTFLYASGPEYLTKVVRVPDVKEVDKYGRPVF